MSDALAAGAIGYILKDCEPPALLSAVRAAAAGPRAARPARRRGTAALADGARPGRRAQRRARPRCCGSWRAAWPTSRSAARLGISERTVKAHLGRVFREIGVSDRTSAAMWARDNLDGLLPSRVGARGGGIGRFGAPERPCQSVTRRCLDRG